MSSVARIEEQGAEHGGSLVGKVVSERYRIERHIRSSNMSHVYEGHDLILQRRVAVKILHEEIVNERTLCRFFLEARIGRLLGTSSHTVSVIDVGFTASALPYLVMEYLVGEDLAANLRKNGRISAERAIAILLEVCSAVAAIHGAGVVHRDLKPSNVFLKNDNHVCLIDFGVCKLADSDFSLTHTGELVGSLHYVPPERWVDPDDARLCGDVWSLAVILYELLTGCVPFKGQTRSSLQQAILTQDIELGLEHGVLPELDTVLLVALHKDPRYRYTTVTEFAGALARAAFDAGLRDEPGWLGPGERPAPNTPQLPDGNPAPNTDTASANKANEQTAGPGATVAGARLYARRWRAFVLSGVGVLGAISGLLSLLNTNEAPAADETTTTKPVASVAPEKAAAESAPVVFDTSRPPPVATTRRSAEAPNAQVARPPRSTPVAPVRARPTAGNDWDDELGLSRPVDPAFPRAQSQPPARSKPQPSTPGPPTPDVDLTPDDLRRF